jgi:hypothetical protein
LEALRCSVAALLRNDNAFALRRCAASSWLFPCLRWYGVHGVSLLLSALALAAIRDHKRRPSLLGQLDRERAEREGLVVLRFFGWPKEARRLLDERIKVW